MEKGDWIKALVILEKCNNDFQEGYSLYKKGSNKKKRDEGKRRYESAMALAKTHIEKSSKIFDLLTGEKSSEYQQAINYGEFQYPHWFYKDLPRLIEKIRLKILELEETEQNELGEEQNEKLLTKEQ